MHNISLTLTGQKVTAGGTRQPVTKRMITRPWQALQPAGGTVCPFCPPERSGKLDKLEAQGEVIEWYPSKENYKLVSLKNIFTPFLYHELLVPKDEHLWPSSVTELAEVLKIIFRILRERVFPVRGVESAQFGFHHGQHAGQNMSHPHWHIIGSDWPTHSECEWCEWRQKESSILFKSESFVALLDGVRAGETVIVSRVHHQKWEGKEDEIADRLGQVVRLFQERFNNPDFIISSALESGGHFWLSYTPILNQWGCTEVLATRGLGPYAHPCSPEAMLQYLRTGKL
ncbi:MAG: HIT domain-containing protein [bacterium]|nr:HIT domain-containing protein [bacterium]